VLHTQAVRIVLALLGVPFLLGAQDASAPSVPAPLWHYGAFADGAYIYDTDTPANHVYRFRSTTAYVDEPTLNMAAGYVRKDATTDSRWGMEFTLQAGKDTEAFGYSATAPNLEGSRWLRHLGPTDVSYLAPVGKGLTIQGGIFSSLIGYESLYAKDNFTYIRAWGADYTPYLMMGVNVSYPFTSKLTGVAYIINGYSHLADPNSAPTTGGQLAYKATSRTTLKETVLYGPQQSDTALEFWRFFSDSIAEWKSDRFTTALEYQAGEEKVVGPGAPRAFWTAALLPLHWSPRGHWSVTVRPEIAWDRNGQWTGTPQTLKAITESVEYHMPYRFADAIVRLEHRYDNSHGTGAGFFYDTGLFRPSHNLFAAALIVTLEGSHK
jgi:Putative beta-barrel porin-2, OmpL-like. bbp2